MVYKSNRNPYAPIVTFSSGEIIDVRRTELVQTGSQESVLECLVDAARVAKTHDHSFEFERPESWDDECRHVLRPIRFIDGELPGCLLIVEERDP